MKKLRKNIKKNMVIYIINILKKISKREATSTLHVSEVPPEILMSEVNLLAILWRLCRSPHKRHTYATRLFELGEKPKTVQELLGHSDTSVTLGTYTHVLESMKVIAASKLDDLYISMQTD